jgi:exopolysaccharide biosynthesis polyprenyl glycosylphosphotransferase
MTSQAATGLRHGDGQDEEDIATRSSLISLPADRGLLQRLVVATELDDVPPLSTGFATGALERRLLGLADVLAVALALVLVLTISGQNGVAYVALSAMPLVLIIFKIAGLYERDELLVVPSTLDEAPLLLQLTGLSALSVTMLLPALLSNSRLGGEQIAALWLASFAAVFGGRLLARAVVRRVTPVERCLVIGALEQVDRISDRLTCSKARAAVVACLPLNAEDVTELVGPELIEDLVDELCAHRIIIAPGTMDAGSVGELIRIAKAIGVRVSVLPGILEVVGSSVEFDDVEGMTMLGVRRFGLSRSSHLLKRGFDLIATSLVLIVVGPLIAAIAVLIKLDSMGPAFFRQVRVGRNGKHFRIVKFRSMVTGAEALKDELRTFNDAGEGLFKLSDDPRVTRVGLFLRRSSLDELPQLFNVLRGEMSLVGPRPLVTDEDAQVFGLDRTRLYLTPGMTGPWQILGSRVPLQEMVGIDYMYVTSWSLWLDLKILLRTIRHIVRRGNL